MKGLPGCALGIKIGHLFQKKPSAKALGFFNEINPVGICEIRFACEILLRNVKCAAARRDLFHFTWCVSIKFHNSQSELFHILL